MREIKFKIWDKTRNKMLTSNCGAFLLTQEGNAVFHQNGNNPLEALIEQIDYEVLMYTGLKDKNGTEIYEGDIVFDSHCEENGKVIFNEGCFVIEWENIEEDLFENCDVYEVIGNIYQDGDILNDNKNTKTN